MAPMALLEPHCQAPQKTHLRYMLEAPVAELAVAEGQKRCLAWRAAIEWQKAEQTGKNQTVEK